jgi:hypothetical protein
VAATTAVVVGSIPVLGRDAAATTLNVAEALPDVAPVTVRVCDPIVSSAAIVHMNVTSPSFPGSRPVAPRAKRLR